MAKLALSTAQELIVFKNVSIPQGVDAVNAPSKSAPINNEEAWIQATLFCEVEVVLEPTSAFLRTNPQQKKKNIYTPNAIAGKTYGVHESGKWIAINEARLGIKSMWRLCTYIKLATAPLLWACSRKCLPSSAQIRPLMNIEGWYMNAMIENESVEKAEKNEALCFRLYCCKRGIMSFSTMAKCSGEHPRILAWKASSYLLYVLSSCCCLLPRWCLQQRSGFVVVEPGASDC